MAGLFQALVTPRNGPGILLTDSGASWVGLHLDSQNCSDDRVKTPVFLESASQNFLTKLPLKTARMTPVFLELAKSRQ